MSEPGEDPNPRAAAGPESPIEEAREQAQESPATQEKVEAAQARVKELEAREKELLDRLARLQADFENFRRRSREESAQASARGKEAFVKTVLPVLDNLDRALAHADDAGLKLLARQLQSALADQGLLVLDPTGEAFDAKVHEAIASEEREGVKAGTVVTTVEKGYALDGRILRPARVVVAT